MHKTKIIFLLFLAYVTSIFLLPSHMISLLSVLLINFVVSFFARTNHRLLNRRMLLISPFALLTFACNLILDGSTAFFILTKLLLSCQITLIYSQTLTTLSFAKVVSSLFAPLHLQKDIELIIVLTLSFLPILKPHLRELQAAAVAKNFKINPKHARHLLFRFISQTLRDIDNIDATLISKGISG